MIFIDQLCKKVKSSLKMMSILKSKPIANIFNIKKTFIGIDYELTSQGPYLITFINYYSFQK